MFLMFCCLLSEGLIHANKTYLGIANARKAMFYVDSAKLRKRTRPASRSFGTTCIGATWCFLAPCSHVCFEEVEGCVPKDAISSDDDFMTMFNKVNQSRLKSRQWCIHHKRFCPVLGDDAAVDYNCGGLPCWDFSMAGLRRQEQGETRKVFIAYAGLPLLAAHTSSCWLKMWRPGVYFNFSNGYVHAKC